MKVNNIEVNLSSVPKKKHFKSLINKYISPELYVEIMKLSQMALLNNNEKTIALYDLLDRYGLGDKYFRCGRGTNRVGIMFDGYCVKVALDDAGMLDNKREFAYAPKLEPYCTRVYECKESGLLAVFEYVTVFDETQMSDPSVVNKLTQILSKLADRYFIGDIGITTKNYTNWGFRRSTNEPVMLDFAYIYDTSYRLFSCENPKCGRALLRYNNTFTDLVCPVCGKSYPFKHIREKINTKTQISEIGDITKQGYVIKGDVSDVELPTIIDPDIDPDVARAVDEAREIAENEVDFFKAQKEYKEYKKQLKARKYI